MERLHLLSNAHLDPVWQWQWQEGVGTAITTFSAAADFCEEFDDYIFCHNEAILYKWVEENDLPLFKRIQKLVKSGKWFIMGGWYLQPDCNMPSGESFIRQISAGIEYFTQKFEGFVPPKTAINFDSFGHTKGLVQILNDAGYNAYVCTRPGGELHDRNMIWKGFNNSQVMVHRATDGYNTLLGQIDKKLEPYITKFSHLQSGMFLWGVGNHGGGPSRQDYKIINQLKQKYPEIEFIHSTPDKYFAEIEKQKNSLADCGDLNYVNRGCYTSQIRIKQLHMRLENELYSAEKMAAHVIASGYNLDVAPLKAAEEDLLFSEFHDILPGSSIKSAEDAAIMGLNHGIEETSRVKLKAFFKLVGGQEKAGKGEYPIIVYNPHPYQVSKTIECEFMLADQNWSQEEFYDVEVFYNNQKLESQLEKEESNLPLDWRKKIVFNITMPPFSCNRVKCFTKLKKIEKKSYLSISNNMYIFDNGALKVQINSKTGLVDKIEAGGKVYCGSECFKVNVIKNYCDPWGFDYDDYQTPLGSFEIMDELESAEFAAVAQKTLCPIRIIEDGDVRTIVECFFKYKKSSLCMQYKLPKTGAEMEVSMVMYNNEKDVKIKMQLHSAIKAGELLGKTAFGVNNLVTTGQEVVAQDYIVYKNNDSAMSVINFGNYGLNASNDYINCSLINSSAYTAHPIDDRVIMRSDRMGLRIDQGEREFRFVINFSNTQDRLKNIEFESAILHQVPYVINYFPTGTGAPLGDFITLDNKQISLVAVKNNNDEFIVRLYNSSENSSSVNLKFLAYNIDSNITFNGYEFKTFKMTNGSLIACNCLLK